MDTTALLLVCCFIMMVSSDNSAKIIYIEKTSCSFIVLSHQNNFTFLFCNTPVVSTLNNWAQCVNTCCPNQKSFANSAPSLSILTLCQTSSTQSNGISISTIIVFTVVALIGCSMFLCFCCILIRFFSIFRKNHISQQLEENIPIEWIKEKQNLTINCLQLKWCRKGRGNRQNAFNQNPCSICLQDNPNSELFCRHKYHFKCIGLWLGKSNFCPLCHRQDIKSIKIYCQGCYQQYIICRRGFLMKYGGIINNKCVECTQNLKQYMVGIPQLSNQQIVFDISSEHIISP